MVSNNENTAGLNWNEKLNVDVSNNVSNKNDENPSFWIRFFLCFDFHNNMKKILGKICFQSFEPSIFSLKLKIILFLVSDPNKNRLKSIAGAEWYKSDEHGLGCAGSHDTSRAGCLRQCCLCTRQIDKLIVSNSHQCIPFSGHLFCSQRTSGHARCTEVPGKTS